MGQPVIPHLLFCRPDSFRSFPVHIDRSILPGQFLSIPNTMCREMPAYLLNRQDRQQFQFREIGRTCFLRFVGFPNEPDLFKVVHSADRLRRFGRWLRLVFGSRAELTIPAISFVIDGEKCCSRACWNRNDVKDPFFGFHDTVAIAQLVRASDCDSEGRGFESL